MFFRILKKDLKRKKTMNIILLLFVIMCSMFAAASVNNIIAVTGGIEDFFDRSDYPDVVVYAENYEADMEAMLAPVDGIKSVRIEKTPQIFDSKCFSLNGKKFDNFVNPALFHSDENMCIKYFDEDNNVITDVPEGCFYASTPFILNTDLKKGDTVEISLGDTHLSMKFLGRLKGADINTESMSGPELLTDSKIWEMIDKEEDARVFGLNTAYIETDNVKAVQEHFEGRDKVGVNTKEETKSIYLYDMLAAYIMMIISIVLMFAAFVMLRFSIGFTIQEEFREIGVMKAVGINNGSIRRLYIIKYLALSVVGSVVGFICSIPLSNVMLDTISKNMVFDGNGSITTGMFCSAGVIAIIMLFCYFCTRKVKKLSPIDAVRNGQTGERFKKKSLLHLGRSRLPSTGFLAVNDVVSAPKQFSIIILVFTICTIMMTMMSSFATTLKSEKIMWLFSVGDTDASIGDVTLFSSLFKDATTYKECLDNVEKVLEENDIPGKCSCMMGWSLPTTHGDITKTCFFLVTKNSKTTDFRYDRGSAPMKTDEVAVTEQLLEDLDCDIGDRITMNDGEKDYEFIITGTYSSFNGYEKRGARLHQDFELALPVSGSAGIQIKFDGDPDQETIDKNIEKLRDVLETDRIYNNSDMINNMTTMSDTLNSTKHMMMILTVIITALVVILMERSFISKQKSEIALMKAVGIPNKAIIAQHTIRFGIVSVIACTIASIIIIPITNAATTKIFTLIGSIKNAECDYDPFELFFTCPMIVIGVTLISAFLTSLYTKTINASDTASIE